jgi:hypothetical protein
VRLTSNLILAVAITVMITGCATSKTVDMLNSRMGLVNYEEAIQRFGPPTQCAEERKTKTCTWVYGSGGMVFAPIAGNVSAIPIEAPSARLTFSNGILSYWELRGNWE